jgi:hypothetical protein
MADIEEINEKERIRELVEEDMPPLGVEEDNDLYELLLFFALLGVRDAERQSTRAGGRGLTREERTEIDRYVQDYVQSRIGQLSNIENKVPPELFENSLTNPELPQSLNTTSMAAITGIIVANLPDGKEKVREALASSAKKRAELIATQEAGKAMSVGMFKAGQKLQAESKTWLRTISQNPRDIHLAQVGVTVPYNGTFPDGSFWSNELINCKCGIKINYTK